MKILKFEILTSFRDAIIYFIFEEDKPSLC